MRIQSAVGGVLLALGVFGWLALALAGWITLPPLPGLGIWQIQAGVLPLPGLLIAIGFLTLIDPRLRLGGPIGAVSLPFAVQFIFSAGLAFVLVAGVQAGHPDATTAAVLMLLGTLTIAIGRLALESLRQSDGVSFETQWGGLGGGLGGWRISSQAVLVGLLILASLATVAVGARSPTSKPAGRGSHSAADALAERDHGRADSPKSATP